MKIRTDFVTNSSSSSFVAVTVTKKDGTEIYGKTSMGSGYHEIPILYFYGDERDIIKEAIDASKSGIELCEKLYESLLDDIHSVHDTLDDIRELEGFEDVSVIRIIATQEGSNGGSLDYTYNMESRTGEGKTGNIEWDYYDDFEEEDITSMYDGVYGMNMDGDFIIKDGVLKEYKGKEATITVPNGVIGIGCNAFPYMSDVVEIYLPDSVKFIDRHGFSSCHRLKKVQLPKELECIGARAFENCRSLEEIEIPDTVVELGYKCFSGSGLKRMNIPKGVSKIKGGLFYNCKKLEGVTLPSGLTEIGADAFCGCENLKEIQIPKGVEIICDSAFWNCKNLEKIYLPSTVRKFFAGQIYYCDNLKAIEVDKESKYLTSIDGVLYTADLKRLIKFPPKKKCTEYTVDERTLYIGEYAFEKNEYLEKANLPSKLKAIGLDAFKESKALKEIDLPASLVSLGVEAFRNCKALTKVYASKSFEFDPDQYFDMWRDDLTVIKK